MNHLPMPGFGPDFKSEFLVNIIILRIFLKLHLIKPQSDATLFTLRFILKSLAHEFSGSGGKHCIFQSLIMFVFLGMLEMIPRYHQQLFSSLSRAFTSSLLGSVQPGSSPCGKRGWACGGSPYGSASIIRDEILMRSSWQTSVSSMKC